MEDLEVKIFYKDKRVLITGHTGFKGSWLTFLLKKMGADIIGYAIEPPTNPNLFEILNLKQNIVHITGDIRNENKLKSIFKKYKPEIVFHMAAQPLVRRSYLEPKYTYEVNVMGTIHVLEAIRTTKSVKVFVNVTSDKCYENKEWFYSYRENDPMGGYDPYSSSKGCAELVTSAYIHSFFSSKNIGKHRVAIASVRAGNVIGGGDWGEDRLIPDCIRALSQKKSIKIRNPKAIRPWQYVLDPLSGYLLLAYNLWNNPTKFIGSWNFGPADIDLLNVEEIVKKVIDIWGSGSYTINPDTNLHEAGFLKLDIGKATSILGWRPIWNINEALVKTIEWYKTYYSNSKPINNFTLSQITEHMRVSN